MMEDKILQKSLKYIEEHLSDHLTLDKIARQIGYSKFHLNRLFSEKTDYTIMKYIQRRRLQEAARKLAETEIPIIEIAEEACYSSQQAFTHAFNQLYHQAPRRYRISKRFIQEEPPRVIQSHHPSSSLQMRGGICA